MLFTVKLFTGVMKAPEFSLFFPSLKNVQLDPKIQQTKMLATCKRFGHLFLNGLV